MEYLVTETYTNEDSTLTIEPYDGQPICNVEMTTYADVFRAVYTAYELDQFLRKNGITNIVDKRGEAS